MALKISYWRTEDVRDGFNDAEVMVHVSRSESASSLLPWVLTPKLTIESKYRRFESDFSLSHDGCRDRGVGQLVLTGYRILGIVQTEVDEELVLAVFALGRSDVKDFELSRFENRFNPREPKNAFFYGANPMSLTLRVKAVSRLADDGVATPVDVKDFVRAFADAQKMQDPEEERAAKERIASTGEAETDTDVAHGESNPFLEGSADAPRGAPNPFVSDDAGPPPNAANAPLQDEEKRSDIPNPFL